MRMSRRMALHSIGGDTGQPLGNLLADINCDRLMIQEDGLPVPFLVLKHGYPDAGNGLTLLLRETCYTRDEFGSSNRQTVTGSFWKKNLESDYFPLIDSAIFSLIPEVSIVEADVDEDGDYRYRNRSEQIFFLSLKELGVSLNSRMPDEGSVIAYFNSNAKRIARYEGDVVEWWTRSRQAGIGSNLYKNAYDIEDDGTAYHRVTTRASGYRPAFTLPSDLLVSTEPDADGVYWII